jgi:alkylhydroperoxidase family enzyme
MARVPPAAPPLEAEAQQELDRQLAAHGQVTNMKRTLAHSSGSLRALMEWYPLRDEVETFLGKRATLLFAHAISTETECLICSTFFRRILIDGGEDPDRLALDDREAAIVELGRTLTRDQGCVPDAVYDRVAAFCDAKQMVALVTFAAIMIATNVFNNALDLELDDYLAAYRRPGSVK